MALIAPPNAQALATRAASTSQHLKTSARLQARVTVLPKARLNRRCGYTKKLVPRCGISFGAYAYPRNGRSQADAFRNFERLVKRRLDIVHVYHRGNQLFPTAAEIGLARQPGAKRRLYVNWKPGYGRYSWAQVANGRADRIIDKEARYLRKHFRAKFFLTIHHEPEDEVRNRTGSGYTAKNYRKMYRHVARRLRARGVRNAVFVMNYMGAQKWAHKKWYHQLYPGNRYVDWIAFDLYSTASIGGQRGSFSTMMNQYWSTVQWRGAYRWSVRKHPKKPIMLGEWGVEEKAGDKRWKAHFYRSVSKELHRFPRLKAMVYFSNPRGKSVGDVRPNTSARSLKAFQKLAASASFE